MLNLLWVIAAILVAMWLLGFALHFTLGGIILLLLIMAIVSGSLEVRRWSVQSSTLTTSTTAAASASHSCDASRSAGIDA